jgi:hypothetical protein
MTIDATVIRDEVEEVSTISAPLDERVIAVVRSCPDYTIRPARLAAALGVSL